MKRFLDSIRGALSQHRSAIGYGLFTLAVMIVGVITMFPHEEMTRRLLGDALKTSPIGIDFRQLRFRPLLGYKIDGLRIAPDRTADFLIQVDSLDAAPNLTSLLLPGMRPAVDIEAELWGGRIDASLAAGTSEFSIDLEADDLNLGEASAGAFPQGGSLRGSADLSLELQGRTTGEALLGNAILNATNVALDEILISGFKVPELSFSNVTLRASLEDRTIRVIEFTAQGAEVVLRATGKIGLRTRLEYSTLDIRFEVTVADNAPPGLRALRLLLPKKPGDSFHSLRGTLRRPVVR